MVFESIIHSIVAWNLTKYDCYFHCMPRIGLTPGNHVLRQETYLIPHSSHQNRVCSWSLQDTGHDDFMFRTVPCRCGRLPVEVLFQLTTQSRHSWNGPSMFYSLIRATVVNGTLSTSIIHWAMVAFCFEENLHSWLFWLFVLVCRCREEDGQTKQAIRWRREF